MSLFPTRARPAHGIVRFSLDGLWQAHLRRKAAREQMARLLARGDDRLLDDVGVDRETAHRLLGETTVVPHRVWDRWQG